LKKKRFRIHSLGEFYIHRATGKIAEGIPYKKIAINPDVMHSEKHKCSRQMQAVRQNDLEIVKTLVSRMRDIQVSEVVQGLENFDTEIGDGIDLSNHLKKQGIPLRILGRFCENTEQNYLKEVFVREILARSACNVLRNSFGYLKNLSNKMNTFNLKKSLCFHLNNIFGSDRTADDAKAEMKAILDYVVHKYSVKLEKDIMFKVHTEGLAIRIIQLIGAKLTVKLQDVNFFDTQPFLPHYFDFEQPKIMYSVNASISNEFLDQMGDEYYALVNPDAWWIESGPDMQLAIFFYSHSN
jgi:hypothetical protein